MAWGPYCIAFVEVAAGGEGTARASGQGKFSADGPGTRRVIRVTGDFGDGSSLSYNFGNGSELDSDRYRFVFRVRGTPGHSVEFELGDDWCLVSKEARIPLTGQCQGHFQPRQYGSKW